MAGGIRSYSTTPGSNNASPPYGWPEGMLPSSVNNTARQLMADVRAWYEDPLWLDYGDTPTRVDNDTITVPTDLTARYAAARRIKLIGATTGYATITSVSYSAPDTTINMTMDSGNVPTSLTNVLLSALSTSGVAAVGPTYAITAAELAAGVTPTNYAYAPGNVLRYGTNTTPGTTDMTTPIANALLANAGAFVYVPSGTYKVTATLVMPASTRFYGDGPQKSIIKRGFNGTMVTETAVSDVQIDSLTLDGNTPTYTGKGIVLSGACLRPVFDNLWSISMGSATDTHLEFGADAGQLAKVSRWDFRLGGGTLDFRAIHFNGPDTAGAFRSFSQVQIGNGYVSSQGSADTQFTASSFARIETDSATGIMLVVGCTWANLGVAMTINANGNMTVVGCRFSGSVTLSSTFSGTFVGNTFSDTSYTLTNNATVKALVLHMPNQGALNKIEVGRNTLTNRNGVNEIASWATVGNIGNGNTTYTPDVSANLILYNSVITADRTVTLNTPARNGQQVRVVRQAGATGAFNVNVGTGPLKALAAASTWCEVSYSTVAAAWELTAAGTL